MKLNKDFLLRNIGEEFILIPVGDTALHFNEIIMLNEVEAFMWGRLFDGADREELIESILDEYEVTKSVVEKDVDYFLKRMSNAGVLEMLGESEDDSYEA